jgi:hypothetical protein
MNEQWQMWADLIRSDQMTAPEVERFLAEHPVFALWYQSQLK